MISVQSIVTPTKPLKNKYLRSGCQTKYEHKNSSLQQRSCVRCVHLRAYGIYWWYLISRTYVENNA